MQHFTCDLCGKELRPGDDQRYVVRMEAYAAYDPAEITEEDLDEDHMQTISELLEKQEEEDSPEELTESYKKMKFDLCPDCHKKFLRDPLNKEVQKFHFSKN